MRHGFEHAAWTDARVKEVQAERRGYEVARGLVPDVARWARTAVVLAAVALAVSLAVGAWAGWAWSILGLAFTVVGLSVTLVMAARDVSRAIPPRDDRDLRTLTTDELEALQAMTRDEPEIASAVARWIEEGKPLRLRDLLACEAHFAKTADAREERIIRARLTARERLA